MVKNKPERRHRSPWSRPSAKHTPTNGGRRRPPSPRSEGPARNDGAWSLRRAEAAAGRRWSSRNTGGSRRRFRTAVEGRSHSRIRRNGRDRRPASGRRIGRMVAGGDANPWRWLNWEKYGNCWRIGVALRRVLRFLFPRLELGRVDSSPDTLR